MQKFLFKLLLFACSFLVLYSSAYSKKPLTFDDAVKFKTMRGQIISEDGKYVAFYTYPDRGDFEGYVKSLETDSLIRISNGINPQFNQSAQWAFFTVRPTAIETENADKDKPKSGIAIVNTLNGKVQNIKNVSSYICSNDGRWLVYQLDDKSENKPDDKKKNRPMGKNIVLRYLENESELAFSDVSEFRIDSTSNYFVFVRSEKDTKRNGLYYIDLNGKFSLPIKIDGDENTHISNLKWNNTKNLLAYIKGKERFDGRPDTCSLKLWNPIKKEIQELVDKTKLAYNLKIPTENNLYWTKDGNRLFFGIKAYSDTNETFEKITYNDSNFCNLDTIRKQTTLDMWHTKDPRIKPHQKKWWDEHSNDSYTAYYDIEDLQYVQLGDSTGIDVKVAENSRFTLATDDSPYLYRSTWQLEVHDLYKVNLNTGERKLVQKELLEEGRLSPDGKYIMYFKNKNWWLHNCISDSTYNLTANVKAPFYDEENDVPREPSSYGIAGWLKNDEAVILYDRYDLWIFYPSSSLEPFCLTDAQGRRTKTTYRIIKTDTEKKYFEKNETLLLSAFDNKLKTTNLANLDISLMGASKLTMEDRLIRFIQKAKKTNTYLFSKEAYNVFPDLWVCTDTSFSRMKKITDVNPQLNDYYWGKMELISYTSTYGDSLMGYYIKPENYDPNKRYPVVIFFYEIMSNDAYKYSNPWNNHLPSAPLYSGEDYVMFYPDVTFKTGQPGQSSINCLIPACRKLAEVGIADTNAIGLWGHSWSGYQASYIITQTDFFACAIAGAPVGNMTSAYSGIRLGSGLTRQFQYEYEQSRIGGSLWDSLQAYIDNSPVFFANKVNTPILIEFGNLDDAVPWTQGMELFLALRRAQKDAIMLEYRNEPHHPRKYFNRMDYAIRMKEYYDTYLKKKPAPEWILKGIEYRGK